jgi:hypothetical protein
LNTGYILIVLKVQLFFGFHLLFFSKNFVYLYLDFVHFCQIWAVLPDFGYFWLDLGHDLPDLGQLGHIWTTFCQILNALPDLGHSVPDLGWIGVN